MGVISRGGVPQGKTYGPIPSNLALVDPAVLIGHRTCDTLPDVHTVKLNLSEASGRSHLVEWIPYVQAARDEQEQNLEAFLRDGQLFYRAIKTIRDDEELFIWYSPEYATILGVPQLQPYHCKGNLYWCSNCTESFKYSNCLRAHMRFKCKNRHRINLYINNASPGSGYYHNQSIPIQINGGRNNNGTPSPKQSPSSSAGSGSPSHLSPISDSMRNDNDIHRKRKFESDEEHGQSPKRAASESPISVGSNSPIRNASPINLLPGTMGSKYSPRSQRFPEEETGSAFHRVERRSHMDLPRTSIPASLPSMYPPMFTSAVSMSNSIISPAMLNMNAIDKAKMPHNLLSTIYRPPMTGFGKIIPGGHLTGTLSNENESLRLQRNALMMDLQNIENDNSPAKLAYAREAAMPLIPPVYRSPNPMVGKYLTGQPPPMAVPMASISLAQNWCAKCNASFRMTSDLVYHMRSHHKREFDPIKKKREEKLKCDVCGESFKERHHLTRHMTSHAK